MTADQRFILVGMASSAIFSVLCLLIAHLLLELPAPSSTTPGERLAYALRNDFWAGFALLAGVARVASQRFFSKELDGSVEAEGPILRIHRAYIQNTLEQLLLLLIAHSALSLVLSAEMLPVIPLLVALFLIGRITFWAGYLRSPRARAFGFATTFYPTVCVFLFVAFRWLVG
jgi:hypothetical protein